MQAIHTHTHTHTSPLPSPPSPPTSPFLPISLIFSIVIWKFPFFNQKNCLKLMMISVLISNDCQISFYLSSIRSTLVLSKGQPWEMAWSSYHSECYNAILNKHRKWDIFFCLSVPTPSPWHYESIIRACCHQQTPNNNAPTRSFFAKLYTFFKLQQLHNIFVNHTAKHT